MDARDRKVVLLMCDAAGHLTQVIKDEIGFSPLIQKGAHLSSFVDVDVQEKARFFLQEIKRKAAAFDWEITVLMPDGTLTPLHFAGVRLGDDIFVLIARTRDGLDSISEELMRINNEQSNSLRATAKELSMALDKAGRKDDELYEQLTLVNNDLANLQREMVRKNVELEQLNQQKNRFLGMAAHDLRTPMGIIQSYVEFLESEISEVLNDEQREFISIIKETNMFMLNMVTDLLDVSAIESGRLELRSEPTDLRQLLARIVSLHRTLGERKQIKVEFLSPLSTCIATIDAGKIEQVVNNLIGNAVKFSHPQTKVVVRLESVGRECMVFVRDQGQGIPAEELNRLFKPFGKTSVRGTAGEQSTGLGLAISRRIIEGHKGKIDVRSEFGQGSEFFFTLPLDDGGSGKNT